MSGSLSNPLLFVLVLSCAVVASVRGCTTVLATPESTADGSTISSHSNDGDGGVDPRLVRVPAGSYKPGEMRDIFFAYELFPRYVGYARNVPEYFPTGNQTVFEPIGQIPQVTQTFAYFEQTYGVLNEKQVAISESTCSGVFGTSPAGQGGKALMSVDTLSQLAMERASSAREAVALMGAMAEKYGFYGAGSFEGSAESLMVSDPVEGWVFHVLPDPTGTSAIWVAQRVPPGHVTVVPNIFIIRDVDLTDTSNFLGSVNMYTIARKRGWWKPGTPLDFTGIYSDGEYAHKYYSGRRLWRAFDMLAPSLKLSPEYDNLRTSRPYPFSVKPDKAVSVEDVMGIMSDSLEGTAFDMTRGLAAGPFGSPDRWMPGPGEAEVPGNWERPIALFRTSDSYVIQSRKWLADDKGGVLWFGPHAAHATVFVPFTAGMTHLATEYSLGDPSSLSRASAYWAHRYVENLANLRWREMIVDIRAARDMLTERSRGLLQELDASTDLLPTQVTDKLVANARSVVLRWWRLADELMEKYADGNVRGRSEGYPAWWLKAVGYPSGPPPVPPPSTDWSFYDVVIS